MAIGCALLSAATYKKTGPARLCDLSDVLGLPVRDRIGRAKYIPEDQIKVQFEQIESDLSSQTAALIDQGGQA